MCQNARRVNEARSIDGIAGEVHATKTGLCPLQIQENRAPGCSRLDRQVEQPAQNHTTRVELSSHIQGWIWR